MNAAIDRGDYWEIPFEGNVVVQCIVDYALTLSIGKELSSFALTIGRAFQLTLDGQTREYLPTAHATLGPALTLFRRQIASCKAFKDGTLVVVFTDDDTLRVPADDNYEAWEISSNPSGLRVIGLPGGDLAIWQPV
ncbi:MAG TPA: DUF6188 family protein [Kofleriaceae bacterium]